MKKKALFLTLFILLFVSFIFRAYAKSDDFSVTNAAALSPIEQQKIGREFMLELIQRRLIITDPAIESYIQRLGQELVAYSNSPKIKIHFFVLKSPVINAFAAPGHLVAVNSGLLIYTRNQNELAAVLAHEIAHVTQHHLDRMFQEASQTRLPTIAASLAAIAVGLVNPALGAGAMAAATAGYQQNLLNFSRSNEEEADRIGMETLYRAGFNPMSMPNMFERLHEETRFYPNDIPQLLLTHPYTSERIADSINRARLFPKKNYPKINLAYVLIQTRTEVAISHDYPQLLSRFQNSFANNNSLKSAGHEYGAVLTLIKMKQYANADKTLQPLLTHYPQQFLIQLAHAEIALGLNQDEKALAILNSAYKTHNDYMTAFYYATALYHAEKYRAATKIFLQLKHQHPKNYLIYTYLAKAQAAAKELQNAYITRAEELKLLGNYPMAIQQLKIAEKQPSQNPYAKIQIEARIQEIKQLQAPL